MLLIFQNFSRLSVLSYILFEEITLAVISREVLKYKYFIYKDCIFILNKCFTSRKTLIKSKKMKIIQATSLTVALLLRIIVPKASNMMIVETYP